MELEDFAPLFERAGMGLETLKPMVEEQEAALEELNTQHDRICTERSKAMEQLAMLHLMGHSLNGGKCPFRNCEASSDSETLSAPDMVVAVLKAKHPTSMSITQIHQEMKRRGWKTKSKNSMNNLTAIIGRMQRDNKVARAKRGHYRWIADCESESEVAA